MWDGDKARAILVQPGDTFLMPPGLLLVHAVLTLALCLMQGGMLWDSLNILAILKNIHWIIRNQNSTNEPVPYQLSDILCALSTQISAGRVEIKSDKRVIEDAIKALTLLICDGFRTHETLEILEFCFENNIILCRLPSPSSYMLQPCYVSVFGPLKAAYRDQAERLERGCVGAIRKEHFTYLYSRAREEALTSRNLRAGWAKAGLYPFNPDKVLSDIPKPPTEVLAATTSEVGIGHYTLDRTKSPRTPVTPVTPVSVDAVASLHDLIKQDAHVLDERSKQRLRRHLQKLTNATQLSFAERTLLQEHVQFLAEINNESKVRRATKSKVIGTARVMRYEHLEKARQEGAEKEATKESKKVVKKANTGRAKRGQKRKSSIEADTSEPKARLAQRSRTEADEDEVVPVPWQAPVARMW